MIDPKNSRVADNQTVMISGGKIVHAAGSKNTAIPKHAVIISGKGKFLIPGLWDMHVHTAGISASSSWGKNLLPVYVAHGITGIRDMGGDLQSLKAWRKEAATSTLPRMVIAGPFIDGNAKGFSPGEVIAVTTPEEARAAVRKVIQDGANFIKIGSRLSLDTFFAIAFETQKSNVAFGGHVPDAMTAEGASQAGMKSMEHLFGILIECSRKSGELRKKLAEATDRAARAKIADEIEATFSEEVAQRLFAGFKMRETWQVPTLVWTRNTGLLDKADPNDPGLRYLPESLRKEWTPANADKFVSSGGRVYYQRKLKNDLKIVSEMAKAGVPLLAGSDSLDPFVFPGSSLHQELQLLVSAGLTPMQALQTATSNPAKFMANEKNLGSIMVGRAADMVLLNADPTKDIRNTTAIEAVVMNGKYLNRADLDAMLSAAQKSFEAAAPVAPATR